MFNIEISIYRERLKKYPLLPILVTTVLLGSIFSGFSSEDNVSKIRIPRDSGLDNCQKQLDAYYQKQRNSGANFSECTNFCNTLQERLTHPYGSTNWRTINTILLYALVLTIPGTVITCSIHICCCLKPPEKSRVIDVIAGPRFPDIVQREDPNVKDTAGNQLSLEDIPDPPPVPGTVPGKAKLAAGPRGRTETPEQKALREHVAKRRKEQKEAAHSSKFPPKGPIYIPREPNIPPAAVLPDNIILDKVEFAEKYNEMYIVGSDVDDIELEPSTLAESSASDSKTEKQRKRGNTKTSETDSKKSRTKSEKKSEKERSKKEKSKKSEKKEQPPKKKSGEAAVPQKKPSKEMLPEKKPSKENLSEKKAKPEKKASKEGIPEKKPSKETLPEKKASKETLPPEKKVSKESVTPEKEKKDESLEKEKTEEGGAMEK